jgi:Mlc titration factor MtfA (ptsG expression regulator)
MTGILIVVILIALYFFFSKRQKKEMPFKLTETPEKWRRFLKEKVNFYRNLDEQQRMQFEADLQRFLSSIKITGVQTEVTIEDRLLIASSAIIPLFGFPAWSYKNLDEVLLYPDSFDRNFNIKSDKEIITGMVGSGAMEGKMILSKPSLHTGFDISNDKKNVGIHEFVHLFDKETGTIDGIPPKFEERSFALPWLDLIQKKTEEIKARDSDINEYGATNRQEFFAVASEYFFERPHLLKSKHPELYSLLTEVFHQDMTDVIDKSSFAKQRTIGRNDKCPCGSGAKYKKCCLISFMVLP